MFDGVETWKRSATAAGYDDGNLVASRGENRERRWAHRHALPVKIKILLFETQRKPAVIQAFAFFSHNEKYLSITFYISQTSNH